MGKKLLDFEGKLIEYNKISLIERGEGWNDDIVRLEFTIEINRPDSDYPLNGVGFKFTYGSKEKREEKLTILRDKLGSLTNNQGDPLIEII